MDRPREEPDTIPRVKETRELLDFLADAIVREIYGATEQFRQPHSHGTEGHGCFALALGPAAHDVVVRRLLTACLVTLGRLSPWRLWMISLGTSLAAASG